MPEKKYFAAANTVSGFVSYYDEIFGKCSRVYIIKGGSGTGKSYFMRQCAEHVKKQRDFKDIEYFHCSFDPSSLDGIIINGDLAIIDGTAPHVYEPTIPGAKENIVDLGRFWDPKKLAKRRDELSELFAKKKNCFEKAYGYLGACGALDSVRQKILSLYLDKERLHSVASKMVSEMNGENRSSTKIRLVSALGRDGNVCFDTYEAIAEKTYKICDKTGGAHIFFESIIEEAKRFGMSVCVSYDPLFKNRPNAILVGDTAIVTAEDTDGERLGEYFKKGFFSESEQILRLNEIQIELVSEAVKEFRRAAEIHFSIEKVYVDSMDFERKEEFAEEFLESLVL